MMHVLVCVPGARRQVWGARRQVWGAQRQVWGARRQVWGARRQVWGARRQVWGAWRQVWGARRHVVKVVRLGGDADRVVVRRYDGDGAIDGVEDERVDVPRVVQRVSCLERRSRGRR